MDVEHIGPFSVIMRLVFLIVIVCHIPFTFIMAKEGACIAADELLNETITKHLVNQEHKQEGLDSCQTLETQIIENMDDRVYYGVTFAVFSICVVFSISIDNLLTLFDYLSALTVSGVQFLIPGLAYVIFAR
jgi:hypothetical protein